MHSQLTTGVPDSPIRPSYLLTCQLANDARTCACSRTGGHALVPARRAAGGLHLRVRGEANPSPSPSPSPNPNISACEVKLANPNPNPSPSPSPNPNNAQFTQLERGVRGHGLGVPCPQAAGGEHVWRPGVAALRAREGRGGGRHRRVGGAREQGALRVRGRRLPHLEPAR